ncbi:hypothetical protein [Caballeronia sp. LZ034LL]|uniref:hypothetical protein n=1 Tax=Caballeronia sp. LZ034LL TaxID=3038567 RepID=UPI00285B4ABE|nr:hypothetical protein [Caballeronia sp. LZ034LL]MDR5839302.1 hypothetical protein [Caballeronia sp. LZ034LL]
MSKETRDQYHQTMRFVDQVVHQLFEPEGRRLQSIVDRIVEENDALRAKEGKFSAESFKFYGRGYRKSTPFQIWGDDFPELYPELEPKMFAYLEDEKNILRDRQQIDQALAKYLLGFTSDQNVRDRMPDTLVSLVPSWNNMPRVQSWEEATGLSVQAIKRSQKTLEKIAVYAAARLIY